MMRWAQPSANPQVNRLRRKTAIMGAFCAIAALPIVILNHQHRMLGFAYIGLQVVFLIFAMRFSGQAKQVEAAERDR